MFSLSRMIRTAALALAVLALALSPLLLFAQVVDSTGVTAPSTAQWKDVANIVITLALGLLTPVLMRGLEWMSSWLKSQPATAKRIVVTTIPSIVSLVCAFLATKLPWFPWDPGPVNAMIATSLAFAVHAGDTAKAAKG